MNYHELVGCRILYQVREPKQSLRSLLIWGRRSGATHMAEGVIKEVSPGGHVRIAADSLLGRNSSWINKDSFVLAEILPDKARGDCDAYKDSYEGLP